MQQWQTLYNLWERTCVSIPKGSTTDVAETWSDEIKTLYALGIGMEETLQFLYFNKPSFNEFKNWLNSFQNENISKKSANENVLTNNDLNFWNENGYVVLKNVIPKQQCLATQQAIWDFMGMDLDDSSTWYNTHPNQGGLMLTFTQHPTLNANRNSPIIQKAFEQLYASTQIYKTIDKVSFNPPETRSFNFLGSKLHWDVSLVPPIPFALQGLLYLTDCGPNDGAFHCVPGFHHEIENWLNNLPPNINPREEAIKVLKPIAVSGNAGDFVIWHQALPHCATPNYGSSPRMVQYLTYLPVQGQIQKVWK
ncbi:MAG TPA: phytanoyl-CoA dioxygenase family protein [Bacteroidia bacterium]|nr:phytanoyl-CoA dioxygenase family protein [Bacteroidia bacterium]